VKLGSACNRRCKEEFSAMMALWIVLLLTGLGFAPKAQAASAKKSGQEPFIQDLIGVRNLLLFYSEPLFFSVI